METGFLEDMYSKRSLIKDQVRIVLIGKTGSGKSATGNTLTGKLSFVSKLSGTSITEECKSVMFKRFGRSLQVVDTPGLFDTRASQDEIIKEIKQCVLMTSPGIHALILVSKIGRFTEEEEKTVEYFKKVFGDGLGKYLMIVFTGKDELDAEETTLENYVRTAPPSLQKLVAESNNRCAALYNRASEGEKEAFAKKLLAEIDKMVTVNGGKCYTTAMFRKAEEIMKKREEEARQTLEEEKRKEREAIEKALKTRFDPIIKEQERKMKSLTLAVENKDRLLNEERRKRMHDVNSLYSQLESSKRNTRLTQNNRRVQEERMRMEMEEREELWKRKMFMMIRLQENTSGREYYMQKRLEEAAVRQEGAEYWQKNVYRRRVHDLHRHTLDAPEPCCVM